MNGQQLITFVLLASLAMASGLPLAHGGADAATLLPLRQDLGAFSFDGRLPKSAETSEVWPGSWTGAPEAGRQPDPPITLLAETSQPGASPTATQPEPAPEQPFDGAQDRVRDSDTAPRDRVHQALLNLPLRFVANAGQTDPAVCFTVKGAGHTLFFTEEEVVFSAVQEVEGEAVRSVVRLRFVGANPHPATCGEQCRTIEGLAPMAGVANFFLRNDPAQWRANVSTYGAVAYRALYPGVDLIYRGTEGHLKSEFRLAPGADPSVIQMVYSGVEALRLREDGALVLQTALGELIETAPLIYQEVDGVRQAIPGGYVLISLSSSEGEGRGEGDAHRVGFQVGAYDPARPLVIDPELAYATYLGGGSDDQGEGIAVDGDGNAYVTGWTWSSDFPTTTHAIQPAHGGGTYDTFVTQIISASGFYTYGYSTYLGGGANDFGNSIAVDNAGNTYVTGHTFSSDFPTTTHAIQIDFGGGSADAFVSKIISASGFYTLAYSTYLGGDSFDGGYGIALDTAGNAYVTGNTMSSDFPTTINAIQTDQGGNDAFVTQVISASGFYTYGYSTYLGGSSNDRGYGIAVDDEGNAYVMGQTQSSDFPTTTHAIQPGYGGGPQDAFVTQVISASGFYTYGYSTYLGGGDYDYGQGIAVDDAGKIYVTGYTKSGDFPIHKATQPAHGGGETDAFVTQVISASGFYTYGYSTYLGGNHWDEGHGIAVDSAGNAYVTGETFSSDFPTTTNAIQADPGGSYDVFVTQIISASGFYTYGCSTYLGGGQDDRGYGIAVDGDGNAYLTGFTFSSDFPTPNAIDTTRGGDRDAFVAKITWWQYRVYLPLVLRAYP